VLAAVGSFLPWAKATLSDRGAALLHVSKTGVELKPYGYTVVALGAVAVVVALLAARLPAASRLLFGLPLVGIAAVVLAVSKIHAADPLATKILRLRIGTFQTVNPVAHPTVGVGLWLAVAGGVLITLSSVGFLIAQRHGSR
jgi:uncharacterized membrane protein